jgi:phosphoserine phosphatase RsbU/P
MIALRPPVQFIARRAAGFSTEGCGIERASSGAGRHPGEFFPSLPDTRQDVGHRPGILAGNEECPPIATTLAHPPLPGPPLAPEPVRTADNLADDPRVSVLLVDDHPANLLALEATLADLNLDLIPAVSGREALRRVLQQDFALILMDVNMPGMDGFEAADLIRQRKRSAHTPIIFLTATEAADSQVFKGYAHGAVDYLVKPLVPSVLRSKVAVFVDMHRKTHQLHRLSQREHERQLAEAKAQYEAERLHQEIRLAQQIQQKLFPAAPLPLPGLDIAGASFPAAATGGDYFDYIPMPDGGLAVVVGDVCGHGFGPALLMAELRAYLRAFLQTRTDVSEVVRLLNRSLAGDTDRFVTLLIARIDPATRSLTYAGAGHVPGYVIGRDGDVKARLVSTGFPLAVMPDAEYWTEQAPPLEPGELMLLTTDGVLEAHGSDEDILGPDRMLDLVRANRSKSAREILNGLFDGVRAHCGPGCQPDDMTAIVIKAG